MNVIVLAAGYATRLYPLTQDFPKSLLEVGGRSILERLLEKVFELDVDKITLVSNARYADHFRDAVPSRVDLLVNRSTKVSDRLGAVADLELALMTDIPDQALVLAADNILTFNLADFLSHFREAGCGSLCAWHNPDLNDRCMRGNVEFDTAGYLTQFVEKPQRPKSAWSTAPIYAYTQDDLVLVAEYLKQAGNPDAPGHFVEWLAKRQPLSVWCAPHAPIDVGTHEALAAARAQVEGC